MDESIENIVEAEQSKESARNKLEALFEFVGQAKLSRAVTEDFMREYAEDVLPYVKSLLAREDKLDEARQLVNMFRNGAGISTDWSVRIDVTAFNKLKELLNE